MLAALDRHGVPPNDNVWVDVATLWRQLLTTPDQAAHALGKLLGRVGTQRVLWGTDAIWYGSPEAQIMAMRSFQITPEFQDRYKYPALTDEVKAGLFGLNAAKLFGVDPTATRCGLVRGSADGEHLRRPPSSASEGCAPLGLATARADHPAPGPGLARLAAHQLDAVVEPAYSVRSSRAAGVRAAMRPGTAATRLPSTRAPTAMAAMANAGTVGLGTT